MQRGFGKMALCKQPTTQSQRMNIHPNARLTPRSREACPIDPQSKADGEGRRGGLRRQRTHSPQVADPLSHWWSRCPG